MRGDGPLCFIDTNIWLYALIAGDDANKCRLANQLIRDQFPVISTQVINEICVNLIKKAHFDEDKIRALIDAFYQKYPVVELDRSILHQASALRERYRLSFWDGMIVAAAKVSGVAILYSEDMQHGLHLDSTLRIINPFLKT